MYLSTDTSEVRMCIYDHHWNIHSITYVSRQYLVLTVFGNHTIMQHRAVHITLQQASPTTCGDVHNISINAQYITVQNSPIA